MRKRHLLALTAAFSPLIFGQMCGTATPPQSYDRLDVTPSLTEACSWMTIQEMEEMLFATEQARIAGMSYEQQLAAARAGCTQAWCESCAETLIAQIYER